jgi:serine protease Do
MADFRNTSRLVVRTGALVAAFILAFAPLSAGHALAEAVSLPAPQFPDFADVVEAVSPAVVSVKVESEFGGNRGWLPRFDRRLDDESDFFESSPFFGDDKPGATPDDRASGQRNDRPFEERPRRFGKNQGSGFLVSEDGYVVTNHHVVENGSKFTIVFSDGSESKASLVGADARTDLAVLKVKDARKFTHLKFSTDKVRLGEWVVAMGNPFGVGGSVTAGIVSAHNRAIRSNRYDEFLQIDAAVNRGNSGGPVLNLRGEVVGVNNQILSPGGGSIGIAFAIPAATAQEIVDDLIANGQVVRGWLGVQIQPVTGDIAESVGLADPAGAIVTEPQAESPAAKAGIAAGDIIREVNGQKIDNPRRLAESIAALPPESKVTIGIWRNGQASQIEVTLGKLQESGTAAGDGEGGRFHARLGLQVEPAENGQGLEVTDVAPGSPADRKGLRPGDIIVSVNGEPVSTAENLRQMVARAAESGRPSALVQIRRNGEPRFVAIPIGRGRG